MSYRNYFEISYSGIAYVLFSRAQVFGFAGSQVILWKRHFYTTF